MGELINYPHTPTTARRVSVCSKDDFLALDSSVTHLSIGSNCIRDSSFTSLDLSRFIYLRKLNIGSSSFLSVVEFDLIGFAYLTVVSIWSGSFTARGNHFYLKSCPKVTSLRIYESSFQSYSACEIENNDSLVSIVIGKENNSDESLNFISASLVLRSCCWVNK